MAYMPELEGRCTSRGRNSKRDFDVDTLNINSTLNSNYSKLKTRLPRSTFTSRANPLASWCAHMTWHDKPRQDAEGGGRLAALPARFFLVWVDNAVSTSKTCGIWTLLQWAKILGH